ncbi:hypothetical protein [Streptomyces gelaticus]|nr:hypothetical protein [Streptomyces gelaticus]
MSDSQAVGGIQPLRDQTRPRGCADHPGRGAVAGHKQPGAPDTPAAIEATKRYFTDFGRCKESASSDRELFEAMAQLYPDRVSHQAWLMFGL